MTDEIDIPDVPDPPWLAEFDGWAANVRNDIRRHVGRVSVVPTRLATGFEQTFGDPSMKHVAAAYHRAMADAVQRDADAWLSNADGDARAAAQCPISLHAVAVRHALATEITRRWN